MALDGYRYRKLTAPFDNPTVQDMVGVIDMRSLYVMNNYTFVQVYGNFAYEYKTSRVHVIAVNHMLISGLTNVGISIVLFLVNYFDVEHLQFYVLENFANSKLALCILQTSSVQTSLLPSRSATTGKKCAGNRHR